MTRPRALMLQAGDHPEDPGHHGHDGDDLHEEPDDADDAGKEPESDQDPDDGHSRHGDGVGEAHRGLAFSAGYVFAHGPNATFPPWRSRRHSVTGGAGSSRSRG